MPQRNLTIASLLIAVVYFGVVFAGLRSVTLGLMQLIYTCTFAALVYAAIASKYRGPYWHGFAVAGWAYFLTAMVPWLTSPFSFDPYVALNVAHLTTPLYGLANDFLAASDPDALSRVGGNQAVAYRMTICHCGFTIVLAIAGGGIAVALARKQARAGDGPERGQRV
jgi:hypothetical protein